MIETLRSLYPRTIQVLGVDWVERLISTISEMQELDASKEDFEEYFEQNPNKSSFEIGWASIKAKLYFSGHWERIFNNIEARLQLLFGCGLLTDDKIISAYRRLLRNESDFYQVQCEIIADSNFAKFANSYDLEVPTPGTDKNHDFCFGIDDIYVHGDITSIQTRFPHPVDSDMREIIVELINIPRDYCVQVKKNTKEEKIMVEIAQIVEECYLALKKERLELLVSQGPITFFKTYIFGELINVEEMDGRYDFYFADHPLIGYVDIEPTNNGLKMVTLSPQSRVTIDPHAEEIEQGIIENNSPDESIKTPESTQIRQRIEEKIVQLPNGEINIIVIGTLFKTERTSMVDALFGDTYYLVDTSSFATQDVHCSNSAFADPRYNKVSAVLWFVPNGKDFCLYLNHNASVSVPKMVCDKIIASFTDNAT